ncbi:MAG TPA: VOC family protein [Solirubrobacter sp.]|nr:VOC family protein [Solirubrobacter sp.]
MTRAPALLDGICELTLETSDPEALERFYCETLGCEVLARQDDRIWLSCGERTRLGLWTPGEKEFGDRGGSHVHFAFSVTSGSLDRLRERLQEHGVEHEGPVEHEGGDRSIYFEDPEGNVVEVWDFFQREPEGVDALAE